jgi:Transcriptional regulator
MKSNETKSRIFQAAMELMNELGDVEPITMRDIAKRAKVSLGLINYYFASKEELLMSAMSDRLIKMHKELLAKCQESKGDATEKLITMLSDLANYMFDYEIINRKMLEYVLTKGDMESVSFCLPLLREIYSGEIDEITLRIKAFRIITILQSVFMRCFDFMDFTGIDFSNKEQRTDFIRKTVKQELE